jgi:hypothetical protein
MGPDGSTDRAGIVLGPGDPLPHGTTIIDMPYYRSIGEKVKCYIAEKMT